MTGQDLIKTAGSLEQDTLNKIAAILYAVEKVEPSFAKELSEELAAISEYTAEKVAAQGYGPMAQFSAALGGALAAGVVSSMATDLYDSAKRGLSKSRNFKSIMTANPELKALDKTRLTNTFSTIHRYAPEFTADPIMGGSLLKSVYDAGPGMDHVMVRELIQSRGNLQNAKHTQFRMGPMEGLQLPSKYDFEKEDRQRAHQLKMEEDRQKVRERERADDTATERARFNRDAKLQVAIANIKNKPKPKTKP